MKQQADRQVFSRRDFLKLGGIGIVSLAALPALFPAPPDEYGLHPVVGRARVATGAIYRYREPDFGSERLGILKRDELVTLYREIQSPQGPEYNRLWYELSESYIFSGNLQRIDHARRYYQRMESVPDGGWLGEITVPYADSLRYSRSSGWQPLYRLYYQSVYWITDLLEGPDGEVWYQLTDDLLHVKFCIPTTDMRPLEAENLTPLSPEVPPEDKRIEISLAEQSLTAYEAGEVVLRTPISSGILSKGPSPNGIPTETPPGRYYVQTKMPSRHMGDGRLTSDREAYELPGVPWVCFFHKDGLALHGTYWHSNFGHRMSHGCVNLPNPAALWLYRWTTPIAKEQDWYCRGLGTVLDIK